MVRWEGLEGQSSAPPQQQPSGACGTQGLRGLQGQQLHWQYAMQSIRAMLPWSSCFVLVCKVEASHKAVAVHKREPKQNNS